MHPLLKHALAGLLLAAPMCLLAWASLEETSEVYRHLVESDAGYVLLLANLPALGFTRLTVGNLHALTEAVFLGACFVQWFAIGAALSRPPWRSRPTGNRAAMVKN